jgi:nicotinate phosphoribosyltransferase
MMVWLSIGICLFFPVLQQIFLFMGTFAMVGEDAIKRGDSTDVYFRRTEEVLGGSGLNPEVALEVTASSIPGGWGVFCGLDDVFSLLEGLLLDLDAMPEGNVIHPQEPVLRIEGRYRELARYETALLGFLCHASGIATAAARMESVSGNAEIFSFGSRRQHPAIAAMVERSAWIGGVDGVSNTAAPDGIPLVGTMPHSLVMCYPDPEAAFRAFDRFAPGDVPRIYLCDTWCDEKRESLSGARCGAAAVRLDTPRSRRGDMRVILEEVRWELDAAGYGSVGIVLSGGVTLEDVIRYRDIVDAFGIGGAIANAPVIDFALDIVSIEGEPCAKRGKKSGKKQVWESDSGERKVLPANLPGPEGWQPQLRNYIRNGRIVERPSLQEVRSHAKASCERRNRAMS